MSGMVVCPERAAAEIGGHILAAGGNAADAAVAVAFAQGVVNPLLCGIGGGGAILVSRPDGAVAVLDCATAMGSRPVPRRWVEDYVGRSETVGRHVIIGENNQVGHSAIMIPGFVRGCWELYQNFGSGRIAWRELLSPAAKLAEEYEVDAYASSFWIEPHGAGDIDGGEGRPGYPTLGQKLRPGSRAAQLYLHEDGTGYEPGERIRLADLARTIEQLGFAGGDDFYTGEVAREISRDLETQGELISASDIANYQVLAYEPLRGKYQGYEVYGAPAPNCGAQLIELLQIAEELNLDRLLHNCAAYIDLLARILRATFADIVPIKGGSRDDVSDWEHLLIDGSRAREWARRIKRGDRIFVESGAVDAGTTHISCIDSTGCAVAFTHSLGSVGGAGVVTPGLGFLYNNLAGHLSPIPGYPDSIRPGKRFFSSMPALVFKDRQPAYVVGAPGGSRLNSSVAQVLLNATAFGMDIATAVRQPRFHSEEKDILYVEPAFRPGVVDDLVVLGNKVITSTYMSRVQAIAVDLRSGELSAGADPRGGVGVGVTD